MEKTENKEHKYLISMDDETWQTIREIAFKTGWSYKDCIMFALEDFISKFDI